MEQYLECAAVVGTHGVRGTVRLENRTDSPAVLASLKTVYTKNGDVYTPHKVVHASPQKQMVLASLEGIETVEDAAAWRGTVLYADRKDIPHKKGSFFIADLIGAPVLDEDSGEKHGTLTDVIAPAGREIYVVTPEGGEPFMIPAVPAFICRVETEKDGSVSAVRVRLIEGMKP